MKVSLRREEVDAIIAMADYYIENNREYNNKRAALLLRHKLKRYDNKRNHTKQKQLLQDSNSERPCEPRKDGRAEKV